MKILRYSHDGRKRYGALEGDRIQPLAGELDALVRTARAKPIPLDTVRLLAPVAPSKIVAAGLNYGEFVARSERRAAEGTADIPQAIDRRDRTE